MIAAAQIGEILKQYEIHGWILRRVLLCSAARETLAASLENLFGGATVIDSQTNAVWFSRASANGEAWELRRLTGAPYALIEVFGAADDEATRERARRQVETKMRGK